MVAQHVEDKIKQLLVNLLGVPVESVTAHASLQGDLGTDLLGEVDLEMAIEESFGVDISDADMEKVRTVADLTRYVVGKLSLAGC